MSSDLLQLSDGFARLYCAPFLFDSFSGFHPISFGRILPFQAGDRAVDDSDLVWAEAAHLVEQNNRTRQAVIDAYTRCRLLPELEAQNLLPVLDFFDVDFFELMGLLYANAGMFKCALRWQREAIVRLEAGRPEMSSDNENVYASIGYCLYSLGLFEEAISWSKSCIGSRAISEAIVRALISYDSELEAGSIRSVERAGPRTRFTAASSDPNRVGKDSPRLNSMIKTCAPFQDIYVDWVGLGTTEPEIQPQGYPFRAEFDVGSLVRHKMNLIFATCARADDLVARGYVAEAKRLLSEAALLEPEADIVWDRLNSLSK